MEMLEKDDFVRIMGRNFKWFRYVDDVLVVIPKSVNVENKLRRLNGVNTFIQFTVELEVDNKIPFLDTVIHRNHSSAKFSVHRKPTNKDDFIHYLSAHSEKTKTGAVIGFFLRALRICDNEFLDDEIIYVTETFRKLLYPLGVIKKLKNKAKMIYERKSEEKEETSGEYIVVPYAKGAEAITKMLADAARRACSIRLRTKAARNGERKG